MVEGDGLENRCRGNPTVSSNLTPSALIFFRNQYARTIKFLHFCSRAIHLFLPLQILTDQRGIRFPITEEYAP